ncbi:hypothetical protein PO878_14355 [Iamia majanohamensis]|uniref:Uncharacterized protein n=1 Tax=Iamia majanohamensis TaxID=467976 RepID=A0AAE9Y784_9ACTN|nr:hypothetical protein [Iamia majanohamensis]WCO65683.1 hypothetical protein PO878_14355 [Iamia majanohamensis]
MRPRGPWGARRPRLAVLVVALLAAGAVGCDPGPPAPAPTPPAAPARPGTVRAEVEAWVAAYAFPWVLGREASPTATTAWADQVVRRTPLDVGRSLARSPEGRRRTAGDHLRRLLGREPTPESVTGWGDWLAARSVDQLDGAVAGSGELQARFPGDGAWLDHVGPALLGRPADGAERSSVLGALAGGAPRGDVARMLAASDAGRRHGVAEAYRGLGFAPPGGPVADTRVVQLAGAGGDERVLRAVLAADRAPARVRVGVVGDSVGFDLYYRAGGSRMASSILAPVGGAGRIGCGVLSTDPQYSVLGPQGWARPGDGRCPVDAPASEASVLARGVDVLIWQIGAWETRTYRDGRGRVLHPRSAGLRDALVSEAVERTDGWTARGARRVLLPEWACVGPASGPEHRDPAFSGFVRSVLDRVVAARPAAAAIAPTPPQVCVGGDPRGVPTRPHRVARAQAFHWADGPAGATWGWAQWFAPAVADLPGLR